MSNVVKAAVVAAMVVSGLSAPRRAAAYSVLAHEANILKARFGNRVTYAQSPKSHVLVEFSFDKE
jgi:hypothetical protein